LRTDGWKVNEIMWKNIVEPGRPKITIWRMGILCLIPKVTHILSDYAIIIAFRCNISFTNAPQSYVIRKLPILYSLVFCVTDLNPTLVICYSISYLDGRHPAVFRKLLI